MKPTTITSMLLTAAAATEARALINDHKCPFDFQGIDNDTLHSVLTENRQISDELAKMNFHAVV